MERERLALGLAGWRAPMPVGVREQVEWAASRGFRGVTLNGAAAGCRGRELGRSARRDLAALLRRSSLWFAGLDLWVPSGHLVDAAHADRALGALLEGVDLAADLAELAGGAGGGGGGGAGGAVLNTWLGEDAAAVNAAVRERAEARGVLVADHAWPCGDGARFEGPIGAGLDPATMFVSEGAKADPASAASRLGARVVSARLSDANGAGRCAVGAAGARLDVLGYLVALSTAGYVGSLVIDVRGVEGQERAVWSAARAASGGAGQGVGAGGWGPAAL